MGQSFAGLVLGGILGGIADFAASINAPAEANAYYTRNILCLILGAGFFGVAGAVVGGASAIVDAIGRGRYAGGK